MRLTLCRRVRWIAVAHLFVCVYVFDTHLFVVFIFSPAIPLYLHLGSDDLSADGVIGSRLDLGQCKTLLDYLRRRLSLSLLGGCRSSHGLLNLNRGHPSLEHLTDLVSNPSESGRSSDPSTVDVKDEGRGREEECETSDQGTSPVDSEVGEHLPGEKREGYEEGSESVFRS